MAKMEAVHDAYSELNAMRHKPEGLYVTYFFSSCKCRTHAVFDVF